MIELPHAVVGAAIATKVANPALALPLALASHFVLDLLPHWNPHLNREMKIHGKITSRTTAIVIADAIISLVAGSYIASMALPDITRFITILAGSFFAVLPDVIEGPYFFFGWKNPLITWLIKFQSSMQFNTSFIPGVLTQVAILAATIWWLFPTP